MQKGTKKERNEGKKSKAWFATHGSPQSSNQKLKFCQTINTSD